MPNKSHTEKNTRKRPERFGEENDRNERANNRIMQNQPVSKDEDQNIAERVSRRGYYSRNGGYGGYRGL